MMHQINLKGELYPVKFGMWSLVLFEDMTGKSLINWDIEKELSFKDSLILVYCGLKNGARAEKKEFKLTLEDIADLSWKCLRGALKTQT